MKIAVPSTGPGWADEMADVFGRSAYLLFFDTESGATKAIGNPGLQVTGGAGAAAACVVVRQGADVLVTRRIGSNAQEVLDVAGVQICHREGGTAGGALGTARRKVQA